MSKNCTQKALVISTRLLTPTVKWFQLKVLGDCFWGFKAGQWLDVYVPNTKLVGGYSMCSTPKQLEERGTFELAVKYSDHPPTTWMHEQCKEGTTFSFKFGGDKFYYDDSPVMNQSNIVLIAGGVGVNPLYSIMQTALEINSRRCVTLLYSVQREEEIQFRESIEQLKDKHCSVVTVKYFITKSTQQYSSLSVIYRRIAKEDIEKQVMEYEKDSVRVFICGPNNMIENMKAFLMSSQVPAKHIHYEQWW